MKHVSANGMTSEFNKEIIRSIYYAFCKGKVPKDLQLGQTHIFFQRRTRASLPGEKCSPTFETHTPTYKGQKAS